MIRLFGMECKRIARSILYWVLVLALLVVTLYQYDPSVESELRRTDDPASVFYTAPNGVYAEERSTVPDAAMEQAMMVGATKLLMYNYRDNSYQYYPFGYVKEKTMSAREQAVILQYLMELTGLSEQELAGTAGGATDGGTGDANVGDIPISGGGAFVLDPGKGSINENGQFVINPEDWQYVPNGEDSPDAPETPGGDAKDAKPEGDQPAKDETVPSEPPKAPSDEIKNTPAPMEDKGTPAPSQAVEPEPPKTTPEEAPPTPTEPPVTPPPSETPGYSGGSIGDIPISGGGAFVLEPGQGGFSENGQFVIDPEDWQYVEKTDPSAESTSENEGGYVVRLSVQQTVKSDAAPTQKPLRTGSSFEIQVSFARFREIMEKVSGMIGRNSYFSWTMLKLYYFGNDMEDAPITERQHREFYEDDQVTGAFARYYCDNLSISVLFLPAFVIVDLMLRDKRRKMQGLLYPRTISSARLICTRYAAAVFMTMLPILLLPVRSLVVLMRYCGSIGVQADVLAFLKYTLAWILPTVMLVMAISLVVTALLENYTAILLAGLIWLVGKPPIDKLEGGNYGLFDLIIRHNTLKGYGRMMENIQMLVLNRITISVIALALVALAVLLYSKKRKGGLTLGRRKSTHHHSFKLTAER